MLETGVRGELTPVFALALPAFKPDHQRLESAHNRQPELKQQKKHKRSSFLAPVEGRALDPALPYEAPQFHTAARSLHLR